MKTICFPHALRSVIGSALILALPVAVFTFARAADPSARASSPAGAHDVLGTWVLVGRPGDVGEVPAKGGTLAFRTGTHWTEVDVNPRTGLVEKASGGTYRINGQDYEETVDYGTESVAGWVGKTYKWKVTVEGDTLTRIGIGNPWTHVWKRVGSPFFSQESAR